MALSNWLVVINNIEVVFSYLFCFFFLSVFFFVCVCMHVNIRSLLKVEVCLFVCLFQFAGTQTLLVEILTFFTVPVQSQGIKVTVIL